MNRDHAGRCWASAPTGDAWVRLSIFSDAKRATAGSMPEITYGLRITKVRCRTPRKIRRSSATGSSARRRGAFVRCGRCDGCSRCSPHGRGAQSSSASSMNPWLSTTLPFCMIGTQMQQRPSAWIVDGLGRCVGIFPAVVLEAQGSPVHVRVLRTFFRRHLCKFVSEFHRGSS